MQPDFWHSRWHAARIGFHQSTVEPYLAKHWSALNLADSARVFVPLCGKSLDLAWLKNRGHEVIGVELSDIAIQAFCLENAVPTRRHSLPQFELHKAPRLALYCGDFFAMTPELLANVTAVYDRAALISWLPVLRQPYVDRMTAITQPGTSTLLITLEYPQAQMEGPPFSVDAEEVEDLYSRDHTIEELVRRNALPTEPRMRERGVTQLNEVCYRLIRRHSSNAVLEPAEKAAI